MRSRFLALAAALGTAAVVLAQIPSPPGPAGQPRVGAGLGSPQAAPKETPKPVGKEQYGTMYFSTKVGSFKLLSPGEQPAEGTLTMDFRGTVLIVGLKGTVSTTGNVRKELDRPDLNRQVYFGRGRITIAGQYRAVQFFGGDLTGVHNGYGIWRLFGEFDRNLNTGEYYFAERPQRMPWGSNGITLTNPPRRDGGAVRPKVRDQNPGS